MTDDFLRPVSGAHWTRVMVIVQMVDGSIALLRTEVKGREVRIYEEDLGGDRSRVAAIIGNYFWYPAWVKLTPEQIAACEEWVSGCRYRRRRCADEPAP